MRPAIFFDRDGTLNEEVGYAGRPEQFHILSFAAAAVRWVNQAGWAAVLVSNQAGVARGYFTEGDVGILHGLLRDHLQSAGAHLDGIYYCPHYAGGTVAGYDRACSCRKPQPGMLQKAARDLGLDLYASWMIGDRRHDIACAHAVGARAVLVRTGYGESSLAEPPSSDQDDVPDRVSSDAAAAVNWILAASRKR